MLKMPIGKVLSKNELVAGYSRMIEDRFNAGWSCDLLTVLFKRLNGFQSTPADQMKDQVQKLYRTFVTRVNRKPKKSPTENLPLLIGALDLPVYKKDRTTAPPVLLNDGLHFHGLIMVPPHSRLQESVVEHFAVHDDLYAGDTTGIDRIDVRSITHSRKYVLDYVFKTIGNHRLTYDDAIVVLPRSRTELPDHSIS